MREEDRLRKIEKERELEEKKRERFVLISEKRKKDELRREESEKRRRKIEKRKKMEERWETMKWVNSYIRENQERWEFEKLERSENLRMRLMCDMDTAWKKHGSAK